MPTRADVIVVGLGAMGSAVCAQLARRGASVIGVDRYRPPHPYGSTHGDTRITRLAIGEGREYVPLVLRSHELWRELEAEAGVPLLTVTGGLTIGPGSSRFLRDVRALALEFGIAHENLSGDELRSRFPMFGVGSDLEGYYEALSGYVRPEAAVRAQLDLAARRPGVTLRFDEVVQGFTAVAGGVTVTTDRGVLEAGQLVLCAGPWLPELIPSLAATACGPLAVYRQVMYWLPIRLGYEQLRQMPVFVWDFGGERTGFVHLSGFYGFPAIDGPDGGVKVATEQYSEATMPDGRQHPATDAEAESMYRDCVGPRMPWLGSGPVRTVSCLYTCTPGSRFVIDRHPSDDNVLIVSACSGHGFKHSAAIGEAVAQWVTDGVSDLDLTPFALR